MKKFDQINQSDQQFVKDNIQNNIQGVSRL